MRTVITDPDLLICRIMETHVIARITWERAVGEEWRRQPSIDTVEYRDWARVFS